jgi:hypothetical protein
MSTNMAFLVSHCLSVCFKLSKCYAKMSSVSLIPHFSLLTFHFHFHINFFDCFYYLLNIPSASYEFYKKNYVSLSFNIL